MQKELKIEELFVVNGEKFYSKEDALQAMSYYANSWRPNGTGWINKITITTNPDTSIKIKTEKVYENR